MSKEKKNIPELRFPEFEGDGEWVEKTLGELLEFKNGINASKGQYGKGIKFINVLDILKEEHITYDNIIGKVDVDNSILQKNAVIYGDLLFQRSSETQEEVGTANVYLDKEKTATFGGFVIRGKKIGDYDPIFLNALLKTSEIRRSISSKAGGSTRFNVGQETLSSTIILLPSLTEQQKIAACLSSLDRLIAAHRDKLEALNDHKKGMMQNLFPLEGEKAPKYQFPEFAGDGEWEEKTLGKIATFSKGKGISKSDIVEDGKLPCIRYGELYTHYKETISEIQSYTNLNPDDLVLSEANDVIIPASGETQIDIATASCVTKKGVALGGDLNIIKANVNGVFLSYYLNNSKKMEIARMAQGISVVHLYANQLKTLILNLPKPEEQQKIAACLSSLDASIAAQAEKIEQLQQHKKGLMQGLFP